MPGARMQLLYDAERASAAPRPARLPVARSPAGAGGLLQLQRLAGNMAVAALLAGRGALAPTVVQRCGPVPCDCDDEQPAGGPVVPGPRMVQRQTGLGSDNETCHERFHPGSISRAHELQMSESPKRFLPGPGPAVQRLTAAEKEENLQSPKFAGNGRLEQAFDNSPSIHIGESGQAVRLVQEGLVDDGFPMPASTKPTGELDGAFGRETFTVVKQFQAKHDLKTDGIVGRETLRRLDEVELGGSGGPLGEQTGEAELPDVVPTDELPACELPTGDEEADELPGADGASAFVGGPGSPVLAAFPIPGITCDTRGVTRDALDCARIRSTPIKATKFPNARAPASGGVIEVSGLLEASASATVAGPDSAKFDFGFVQVCRHFETIHAIYRKQGAAPGTGNDLDVNVSSEVRAVQPKHDHRTEFSPPKDKKVTSKGSTTKTGVDFADVPTQPFPEKLLKDSAVFDIAELSWESFFFLAFVAKLPSGNLVPLSTMFWDIKHRETVPPGGASSPGGTATMHADSPSERCRGCRNCTENEAGFLPLGPASVECSDVVLPLANLPARDLVGTLPIQGPGDFKI